MTTLRPAWIPAAEAAEVYVYKRSGRLAEARRALQQAEQMCRRLHVDPRPLLASGYIGIENTKAMAYMEKLFAGHTNALMTMKVDAAFDPLRGNPQFQDLLRRMDFAP